MMNKHKLREHTLYEHVDFVNRLLKDMGRFCESHSQSCPEYFLEMSPLELCQFFNLYPDKDYLQFMKEFQEQLS